MIFQRCRCRGIAALAQALDEKISVHRAMFRNELGWVDFE
ncbi:hypothetical protein [Polaromonas sp. CG9_12]|nr:hypothetical protein [Polaromonas sp. CG9_12]